MERAENRTVSAPFALPANPEAVADLQRRLVATRWNDAVSSDWSYGMDRDFLERFALYWAREYRWDERRALLDRLPHFRMTIDGYGLHFLHFRGVGPRPIPLVIMNGWPSSFVEFQRLAPLLTRGEPCFDIVVPTLPGFGFSDRPTRPNQILPWEIVPKLMTSLRYERFVVAGTDIGSGVATRIAISHPQRVIAAHVSAVAVKMSHAESVPKTSAELAYDERLALWSRDEGGYQAIQSSRPQTLAFALADSPVGLASWILEKFRAWSDCNGDLLSVFPLETLADNLMVYWLTNTIGSSVRYYFEATRLRAPLAAEDFVTVPTAIAMWPHDIALAPRELAERLYDVRRYTVFPRGGHFPAWEAPELYARDLREFVATVTP